MMLPIFKFIADGPKGWKRREIKNYSKVKIMTPSLESELPGNEPHVLFIFESLQCLAHKCPIKVY